MPSQRVPPEHLISGKMGNIVRGLKSIFCATLTVLRGNELKILGERIREKRKSLCWTQEDLADYANLDRSYIGGVERGQRNLTFSVLCQICAAFACDIATLTEGLPPIK